MIDYKSLVANVIDETKCVVILDKDGFIIMANKEFSRVSKYSSEELLKSNISILDSNFHPDEFFASIWNAVDKNGFWDGNIKYKAKDGSNFWLTQSIVKNTQHVDQNVAYLVIGMLNTTQLEFNEQLAQNFQELQDAKKAALNVLEDIEEEKKISKKYIDDLKKFKLVLDNTSEHVVITDTNGIIIYANAAVERITGFKVSEILGQKAGSKTLWGGQMTPDFYKQLWHTIKIEKQTFKGELQNKRKNGDKYYAYSTVSPVTDGNNDVQYFIGIERDITREKEVDKAKTEFVSLASHQLRTPLTGIRWYSELLLSHEFGELNDDQVKFISEISEGTKRMIELVGALLNVSRIELGTFAINPEPTNMIQLLRSVLDELKLIVDEKCLKIIERHEEIPILQIDPKLMRIVYQNLLTNAVKYTPENGSVTVTHSLKDGFVQLEVKDTGYGIPENAAAHIFSKLYRADNVLEKDTTGSGLGLYITKSIVEGSAGKIWYISKENEGTSFFVTLPISGMPGKKGSKPLE